MSFMKKVARIAAPFASLIPGVGPFVGAGLGALGSLGGGGSKSSSSMGNGMDPALMQKLIGGVDQSQAQGKAMFDKGMPLIDQGSGALGQSNKYFSDILGGKADQALSGPISDLKRGYAGAQQSMAQFAPRGGGMVSSMMDRSNQLNSSVARLKSDSLTGAAQGLMAGGSSLLSGGSALAGNGAQTFGSGLSTLLGMRGQDIQKLISDAQIHAQNMGGLGQGIGSILGMLLQPGGLLNTGKKSGGYSKMPLPF